jgi:glucose-1-phosphate cytidylyltransferase
MATIKQVVLLAGGKGTRMREMTETLPKPMVPIGDIPVLEHLINIFERFGEFNYLICSGYKGYVIEEYFKDNPKVTVIDTGEETNTGGRIFKISDYLDENFIVTYGDGLANVPIDKLINSFLRNNKIGTMTVTNPRSRFGLVEFDSDQIVKSFIEKPILDGYINIGFMAFNKKILDFLEEDATLETEPLHSLVEISELSAFIHNGYFEPMDTYREYLQMNELWESGERPWENFG